MGDRVYLDHNATTPVRPEAAAAVAAALRLPGNPSSIHAEGRAARKLVEDAREAVAALVGAESRNVVFTSGATEALNLALRPDLLTGRDRGRFDRLLISAIEHEAVVQGHRFAAETVETVPVNGDGVLDLAALDRMLAAAPERRTMLALTAASNETGAVQPVAEAGRIVHARGGALVVDAVQAIGKIPVSLDDSGADLLVLSGHKFGAPKGVGALVRASETLHWPKPLLRGGGQERGLRAGTENVPGIAGLGAAATIAARELAAFGRLALWRDRLEAGLRALRPDAVIFGADAPRLANTSCFAVPDLKAETALIALDLAGIAVSSGSACSSGKVRRSRVLDAMAIPTDLSEGAIRVSLGWTSREADVARFLEVWSTLVVGCLKVERDRAA